MKKYLLAILLLIMAFPAFATVSTETTRVAYTCNGTSTTYAYTFKILADADLKVIKTLTATGAETTLTLATDYTVTGAGTASGNVVLTAGSKCASGYTMTILRDMDVTQETDYVDGEAFSAESIESALDKNTMILQQQKEELGRVPKLPTTSTITSIALPTPTANNYIGWNASATGLANITGPVSTTATQYEVDALVSYGGGTAYTQATITSALTAIGTTNKATLLLRPGNWVILTALAFPDNVTVKMPAGAYFSGAAVTAGSITGLKEATPEMFGVWVSAATDMTTAINAAISSGGDVYLAKDRVYGTTGGHSISTTGQKLYGNRAMLKKLSGTSTVLEIVFGTNRVEVENLRIDNNSLAGVGFKSGAYYGKIRKVIVTNTAGTDYGIHINGSNLTDYDQLEAMDTNYGGILIDDAGTPSYYGALYSTFSNTIAGATTGYGIRIEASASLRFNTVYLESPIYITGVTQDIKFKGLSGETGTKSLLVSDLATVTGIEVDGGKVINTADMGTAAWFDITNAVGFSLKNFRMQDDYSAANRPYIKLDGATGTTIQNIALRNGSGNAHYFIQASGTRTDYLSVSDVHKLTAGTITNLLKVGNSVIRNSELPQAFSLGSQYVTCDNITGAVNTANVLYGMTCIMCPTITDANYYTTRLGYQGYVSRQEIVASPAGAELAIGATSATGNTYIITGTNNITSIAAASSIPGRQVTLIFTGSLTFTDGNNLKLAGNFATSADDSITLVCVDTGGGANWYEVARSAN